MNNFFKQNIALVVGIALPLLLAALFYVAGEVSQRTVPDPRYAVLFVKDYYDNTDVPWSIKVKDGKVDISISDTRVNAQNYGWTKPTLYILEPGKKSARKIAVEFDPDHRGPVTSPDLESVQKGAHISTDSSAPDGYRFEYDARSGGGLFREIFGGPGHRDSSYALVNSSRRVGVLTPPDTLYSATFLGWVIPDNGSSP